MNLLRLLTPPLRWFITAMILANIAGAMVFTLLPVYLADEMGATPPQIGLVYSIAGLVPMALQIVGGWLSDSVGRLRIIALGAIGGSFGYIGFVLAPSWQWVIVALCLEYISGSLVAPSYGAFVAENSTVEMRGRVYGLANGLFMIVAVVGPLLSGWLAGSFGFKTMFLVACITYLSATVLRIWMVLNPQFRSPRPVQQPTLAGFRSSLGGLFALVISGGLITWIFLTDGVRDVAYNLSTNLQPLYLSEVGQLGVEQIGWLNALLGLVLMIVTFPAGWLSDRIGELRAIAIGFLLEGIGLTVFVLAGGFPGFLLSFLILGAGYGVMGPAYDSLTSKAIPENLRGMAFGLLWTSLGLISLPAPWVGGQLWARFSPPVPFWLTAIAALGSILLVWTKFKVNPSPNKDLESP